jgi:hypothetical protein
MQLYTDTFQDDIRKGLDHHELLDKDAQTPTPPWLQSPSSFLQLL